MEMVTLISPVNQLTSNKDKVAKCMLVIVLEIIQIKVQEFKCERS